MARNPRELWLGSADSRRLVDGGATAKERLLLEAGIDEAPTNSAGRQRALAALGIAVGTGTLASSAKAAMGLHKGVALVQAKWLLLGAVSAAAAVGAVEVWTKPGAATALTTSGANLGQKAAPLAKDTSLAGGGVPLVRSPTSARVPRSAPPPVETARAPAALPSGALAQGVLPSPRTATPPSPPAEVVSSPSELVAQVAALDRARAALRAGSARQSVALLDRFNRRYPGSSLAPEATVVRVSALLALGQRARATNLVRAYCRSGGRGAYGHRLMALVGLSETECESSGGKP